MAGENKVKERLIAFRVYNDANDLLGIATVDLPELSSMTDTVTGAGIAGEVDSPVLGHYQSMTCTLNWRVIEKKALELAAHKAHALELRGSQQVYDAAGSVYSTEAVRITLRAIPKTTTLGTFETGASTDSSQEFEVVYIKISVGGKEVAEIDKYNYISKFGDEDILSSVRADLGLS